MARSVVSAMAASGKITFNDMLRASKDNQADLMEALLEYGLSAQETNVIGQTGLHVAAIWGNVEVSIVLLKYGADVNATNKYGVTPLHHAAQSSQHAVAELLVAMGANTRLRSGNGQYPYEVAKDAAMRKLLGAPELKGHEAVTAGDCAALSALLAEGIDLSEQDPDGDTPLHLSVKASLGWLLGDDPLIEEPRAPAAETAAGKATTLDCLLKEGIGPGLVAAQHLHNADGYMPLHIAAGKANAPICEALLKAGAPINACTLRMDEQHNGQWGKKNADSGKIEKLDCVDKSALHIAVDLLYEQAEAADGEELAVDCTLVKLLLEHGADANGVDLDQQTPLHVAIMGGLHEVAALLIAAKADLSLGCKAFGKNNTALHQAVLLRDVPMIKLLTDNGAVVDAVGRDGWTPLGLAVRSGATAIAKVLLEARANPNAVSGQGKTPLEIATINKKQSIVELLQGVEIS